MVNGAHTEKYADGTSRLRPLAVLFCGTGRRFRNEPFAILYCICGRCQLSRWKDRSAVSGKLEVESCNIICEICEVLLRDHSSGTGNVELES